jgi:hypothetical protein
MFHLFHLDVACVSFRCCKSRSSVTYITIGIHVCCKYMFQMFQLFQKYVAGVLSRSCVCCSGYTHMLHEYVPNILHVSDVCCSKCFPFQVFSLANTGIHRRAQQAHVGHAAAACVVPTTLVLLDIHGLFGCQTALFDLVLHVKSIVTSLRLSMEHARSIPEAGQHA